MSDADGRPSAARIVSQSLTHVMAILRGEIALAKAEMREGAAQIGGAIGLVVVAAVLAVVGLNTLVAAAVVGLIEAGLSDLVATLTVGFALLALAVILILVARAKLRAASLAPKRVASNLRRDADAVKGDLTDV